MKLRRRGVEGKIVLMSDASNPDVKLTNLIAATQKLVRAIGEGKGFLNL